MDEREETRKIQFTGKSSYIVSLPKRWIMDLGLKQGDPINVVRQGSSTLQISPSQYQAKSLKSEDATFEVGIDDDNSKIVRRLISLYFLGFKTIHVKPKAGRFKPAQRTAIKDAVKKNANGYRNHLRLYWRNYNSGFGKSDRTLSKWGLQKNDAPCKFNDVRCLVGYSRVKL